MVFTSDIFLFWFLGVALLVYYASPRALKNLVLTLLSYLFYGWWNPWFTLLLLLSTSIDFACGKLITAPGASDSRRKLGVAVSVISNLSLLGFFKYFLFAVESAGALGGMLGLGGVTPPSYLSHIALPVGISFYTFQSMSYTIDLYRGRTPPARSFVDFACYVSMFPQLVAGPIVRFGGMAPQLVKRRYSIEAFVQGIARFNFGFAKKILLANPSGEIAELCFASGEGVLSAATAWAGAAAFAFQIYFDFSGYSDMAIGLGRMLGFRLPENFNAPYRAESITEFWRRWHLTLSSFLRDYLYIPLGGNRRGTGRTYVNLMVVMLLGGLWHGAQWTFVIWGGIHGALLAMERVLGKQPAYARLPGVVRTGVTFAILVVTWVVFRAQTLEEAARYLGAMCGRGGTAPAAGILTAEVFRPINWICFVACAAVVWGCPVAERWLERLTPWKVALSLALLMVAAAVMLVQGFNPFLYFQF